jgi:hypothetical protein
MSMNRRFAYRDYQILVSALPLRDRRGWRAEICVISPAQEWQLVPTHESLVMTDAGHCLEIGRRCAEIVVEGLCLDAGEPLERGLLH